ncbi:MAG: DUF3536 domain-containing protein [Myxococcota bacterium]
MSDAKTAIREAQARHVCIHGHFYQPPRENPWLERIEPQPSASPYHDWNERIAHECYASNAAARILDDEDYIVDIVNNYERISFNVGPTLMEWLRTKRGQVYEAIIRADRRSARLQNGHGNAIAQAYNHLIMPLANLRDRRTQIAWGIRDFERHFERKPEGMWLPETAVDVDTLEALAEHGIEFTILSPRQAECVRPLEGGKAWTRVDKDSLDTTRAYRQQLPSGRSIAIFFYDGEISQAVAFENLLERGDFLASRLTHAFRDLDRPELVHIATDGETYGHHHRHGEMALAYALRQIQRDETVQLTNYGRFLAEHPPEMEVRIVDHSSWSCVHGVERWRSDCGCQTGGPPGWTQSWRAPLRQALDALRDEITMLYESRGRDLFADHWSARNTYIDWVFDKTPAQRRNGVTALLADENPSADDLTEALTLLEMERQSMLMFTSCGWFFNDVAGIETVQILRYAGRVLEFADKLEPNPEREKRFLEKLSEAESNLPDVADARAVFEEEVRPRSLGLTEAAKHFAISELFEDAVDTHAETPFSHTVDQHRTAETAAGRLGAGLLTVTSERTLDARAFGYVVAHLGDHNVIGGLLTDPDAGVDALFEEAKQAFNSAEMVKLVRWFDATFEDTFDLRALFGEAQSKVIVWLLNAVVEEATDIHEQLYIRHAPLLRFLAGTSTNPPRVFQYAAESVLNERLETLFEQRRLEPHRLAVLLQDFAESEISIDETRLLNAAQERLDHQVSLLRKDPTSAQHARAFSRICSMATHIPVEISLWDARNLSFELLNREIDASASEAPDEWRDAMLSAAATLRIRPGRQ